MQFVIDCEFNGFQGALVSLALVAQDDREFYEVFEDFSNWRLPGSERPTPWVAQHVVPVLGKGADSLAEIQERLQDFLAPYRSITVIADWPEDLKHFCDVLITGPGRRLTLPGRRLDLQVRFDLPSTATTSKIPHNALEDARALARHLGWQS